MYRSTSPPTTRTGTPDLQPRPQRNRECPRLEIKYTEKNELSILTESCKNREFVSQSNGDPANTTSEPHRDDISGLLYNTNLAGSCVKNKSHSAI